jgi:hypothetical protein
MDSEPPLAFLVDGRSGESVVRAHDDQRWVSLSDGEPFPGPRAEVRR